MSSSSHHRCHGIIILHKHYSHVCTMIPFVWYASKTSSASQMPCFLFAHLKASANVPHVLIGKSPFGYVKHIVVDVSNIFRIFMVYFPGIMITNDFFCPGGLSHPLLGAFPCLIIHRGMQTRSAYRTVPLHRFMWLNWLSFTTTANFRETPLKPKLPKVWRIYPQTSPEHQEKLLWKMINHR